MLVFALGILLRHGRQDEAFAYSVLAIVCLAAFLYFTVDGVIAENKFQFLFSILTSFLMSMFVVVR
jgi:hypothetical protein